MRRSTMLLGKGSIFAGTAFVLLLATPALANTAEAPRGDTAAPSLPTGPTDPAAPETWQRRFLAARQELVDGKFAEAARALNALAAEATDPVDRATATHLGFVAQAWAARAPALGSPAAVPASLHLLDRRTTDELALLYIYSVLYGVGSGATLAMWTDPDTLALGILPALGLAAGSAGAVCALDRAGAFGYGVPQSIVAGMTLGLAEGLTFTLWHEAAARSSNEWGEETVLTIAWGTTTAGALAGGLLGARFGTTPGRASLLTSAGVWGALVSSFTVAALSGDDVGQRDDHALLAAVTGLNLGAVGGALLGYEASPSIGRVRFLDLGAISGGLLFGGVYLALRGEDDSGPRGLLGSAAAGISVGAATAWWLTDGLEPDSPRRPSRLSLVPVFTPASRGTGAVLGLAGTI